MKRYLLDTNHLGDAVRRVSVVRDQIQQRHRQGDVFGTSGPILCELLVGVVSRKDAARTRKRLERLLQVIRIWPVTLAVADRYAEIYHKLRKAGRVLSQIDIISAGLSLELDATLLTTDQDFEALPEVKTENWLLP